MNKVLQMQKDPSMPESFKATVVFHDKTTEEHELAYIGLNEEVYSLHTVQDMWVWIPKDGVRKIIFDKNFSTLQAKRLEEMEKRAKEANK